MPSLKSFFLFSLLTLWIGSSLLAQTTGTGATVLQNAPIIYPQQISQVRYADQFPGSDIGAKVNAAFSNCGNACKVIIPASGPSGYSFTTTIMMNSPTQSLVGEGSALTILKYGGSGDAILWQMSPYMITQAGQISGLTIHGTIGGRSGIHSGSIIGAAFEDLHIDGFTGSSGACLWMDNVGGGWTERTTMNRVELGIPGSTGCTKDLLLTVNGGTNSFGYNRWTDIKMNVNAGQIGISAEGGTSNVFFYNSTLFSTCNASGTQSACISLTGNTNWDLNLYDITGEGGGTGISVASGSKFGGSGVVSLSDMAMANANGPSYSGTFRIVNQSSGADGGTISNFLGSGQSANVTPMIVQDENDPIGFGTIVGPNISSPYAAMYNWGGRNAFIIGVMSYGQPPSAMTQVARIDAYGNVHAAGAYYANGSDYAESVHISGEIHQYEPGDVMTIDDQKNGLFRKSGHPYAKNVAGIFSTRPGVLGSSHALQSDQFETEIPLAITGIVPCKVSTENGAIKRGDLLVSSSTSGYAMKGTKSSRMTGAIIGKALEPLESGTGKISVLISLQ